MGAGDDWGIGFVGANDDLGACEMDGVEADFVTGAVILGVACGTEFRTVGGGADRAAGAGVGMGRADDGTDLAAGADAVADRGAADG